MLFQHVCNYFIRPNYNASYLGIIAQGKTKTPAIFSQSIYTLRPKPDQ